MRIYYLSDDSALICAEFQARLLSWNLTSGTK